jgi:heme/copper-type cytochrome/quinol oxidase subunit 1
VGHFHYVLSMGAVFGIFTGICVYWPMASKLLYDKVMMQSFFNQFFLGVNVTFFPMHLVGMQGCPRKYKQIPDKFLLWTSVSSFGAIISTISIWWFITVFINTMLCYRLVMRLNTLRSSCEWCVEPTSHTFGGGIVLRKPARSSRATPRDGATPKVEVVIQRRLELEEYVPTPWWKYLLTG